ncbi:hypothetical protein L0156_10330 [bacterium]|nr:hypothetical protein [bacterium]
MPKAAQRRKVRRNQYLYKLLRQRPDAFSFEWNKRLVSWVFEAHRRAEILRDESGNPTPAASALVDEVMGQLAALGEMALEMEGAETLQVMLNECAKAVSAAVDRRMYRLTPRLPEKPQRSKTIHGTK